mmetsp:Transcript_35847/g.93437  ORF Transcript_35847/g.93437 Transcript_35847/m.93437 type:complete len:84 (-) Transcript_35847:186-437(-)
MAHPTNAATLRQKLVEKEDDEAQQRSAQMVQLFDKLEQVSSTQEGTTVWQYTHTRLHLQFMNTSDAVWLPFPSVLISRVLTLC